MRTAREPLPTKDRLLDAAQRLMLARGYAATTVEEICERARLTKGSFFHYFESKEELGQTLLERFCEAAGRKHDTLFGSHPDPLKRIHHYLDAMARRARNGEMSKGCLVGSFAQELSDEHSQIRQACVKGFARWSKRVAEEFARAKIRHTPQVAFDSHEMAEHFVAIVEGAMLLCKTKKDYRIIERSIRHFQVYVRSLFQE